MDGLQQEINEKQRRQTIAYALAGGLVIAAILLITTIWVTGRAREGTNQAVNRVSEIGRAHV